MRILLSNLVLILGIILPVVIIAVGIGIGIGFFIKKVIDKKNGETASIKANELIEQSRKEAKEIKTKALDEARQENQRLREAQESEINSRRRILTSQEEKINERETSLTKRSESLDRREESLSKREERNDERKLELEKMQQELENKIIEQEKILVQIAGLTKEKAKEIIMDEVKEKTRKEVYTFIQEEEEKAKTTANQKAKELLSSACQALASEVSSEATVTIFDLENDENKGRIIGREGRNIHCFESLTGVDLLIDDTPNTLVISGFDPIRREIASRALTKLLKDGKIHPARIEEVVEKTKNEVELIIHEVGEDALFKANCGKMHLDLVKLLGRLNFRTSYGQNVLHHSLEVAHLAGKLAAELGENEAIARRAGLLHDIGKAVDHEIEGSHVEIGVNITSKYKEPKEVIDAIASHHGDKEAESVIAVLVAAADALSAARPGARNESLENYLQRLEKLEQIANSHNGVDKSYAIQAGREIRVIVKPNELTDDNIFTLAREIKEKIETEMSYPGTIKVTVIREIRAVETAK